MYELPSSSLLDSRESTIPLCSTDSVSESIFMAFTSCASSYETVVKRWPVILTGIIDTIYRTNHDLSLSSDPDMSKLGDVSAVDQETRERIEEGKRLIEKLSKLKYEMGRDRPLECVVSVCDINTVFHNFGPAELFWMTGNLW